ncbi:MAG: RNA methyltransferase [Lutibacter sp.]|nr:MAG: RNA methyltransferase [Lutibacter sp.]
MMLSKSQLKLITSLRQKKYRNNHKLFFVEGIKGVKEFLTSDFKVHSIFCTDDFSHTLSSEEVELISDAELQKISLLKNPNQVLGVFEIPSEKEIETSGLTVVLDAINDPGNLGTIIRLCDWFGVTQIVCSADTVDCYNPKVVQASMGSLTRISVKYIDLKEYLESVNKPIYAAVMDGKNLYESKLKKDAILIMGNEANGISKEILEFITDTLTIPQFGELQEAESLNVATATAILLSEFRSG